jgi:hypothetical protein
MTSNPLIIRASVVAALTAVVNVVVVFGFLTMTTEQERALVVAIDLVAMAILVIWTNGAVTPVADPRGADGEPLVPVIDVADYDFDSSTLADLPDETEV